MILRHRQPHLYLTLFVSTIVLSQVALCRREHHRQTVLINYKEPVSESNCLQEDYRFSDMFSSNQKNQKGHHYYSNEVKHHNSYESSHDQHANKPTKKKRLRCRLIESNTENSSEQPRHRNKNNKSCSCGAHRSHSTREKSDHSHENKRTKQKLKNYHVESSSSRENSKRKNSVSISIKLKQKAQDEEDSTSCSEVTHKKKVKESVFSSSSDEDISDNQSTKENCKCSLSKSSVSNDCNLNKSSKKVTKCQRACTKSLKKAKQIKNNKENLSHKCCSSCTIKNINSSKDKRRKVYSISSEVDSYKSSSCSEKDEKYEVQSSSSEKMTEKSSHSSSSSHESSSSSTSNMHYPGAMNPHQPFWPFPFPTRPCLGDHANRFHGQDVFNFNPFMRMPYVFGVLSKQRSNNGRATFPNIGSKTCKCKKDRKNCSCNG